MGGAGPDDAAIAHLADPRLFTALVGLHQQLVYLPAALHDAGIDAAVHLVVPLAEQLVAGADDLGIGGLVDLPFLQFIPRLLVKALHGGEIGVPAPLGAGLLLNELDARPDILGAHLHRLLVLIPDREAQVEHGQVGEAAGHIAGGHSGAVAGHGGGDKALAHVGQGIDDQRAALGGRHRAAVRRQAEGLHGVDVGHAGELVDLGHQEHRHQLIGDTQQVGEAGHDLAHGHLIEQNDLLIQLGAVAVLLIALGQEHQIFRHIAENVVGHQVAHFQGVAPLTHGVLIHEAHAAHIGDHPAIPERGIQGGYQILGEGGQQHAPDLQPAGEVDEGALHAAPLPADSGHVTLTVQGTQMLFAVEQQVLALRAGHGGNGLGLPCYTVHIVKEMLLLFPAKGLPVRLLDEIESDGAKLLQVGGLRLPVHLSLGAEEFGIGKFLLVSHQLAPPFCLWSFLISSDSTKACTRVRSWPELPLLYRRSMLSTGQSYSSCMMWLTSARSKPQ